MKPTDTRGTVEIICNSKTAKLVSSSVALATVVTALIPGGQLPAGIIAAISATYQVACAAYNYD